MKGTSYGLGWVYIIDGGGGGAEHDVGTQIDRMKGILHRLGWVYITNGGGGGADHDAGFQIA